MTLKPKIYGPDDPEVQDIMDAVRGIHEAQAEISGHAEPLDHAETLEDIAWNAVVIGHPGRFSDMPETTSFAEFVVEQLGAFNCLNVEARPYATSMVAGLLRFLWDRQNLLYLEPKFARGQAGAFQQMIIDANHNWNSVEDQQWFAEAGEFPGRVEKALAYIEAQSWEDVYKVLDPTFAELEESGLQVLDNMKENDPDMLAAVAAYLAGTVIVKNRFSPLDGSVPESIGERMTKLYHAIDSDNDGRFFSYLTKGFESVRQEQETELERWRTEDS